MPILPNGIAIVTGKRSTLDLQFQVIALFPVNLQADPPFEEQHALDAAWAAFNSAVAADLGLVTTEYRILKCIEVAYESRPIPPEP